MTTERAYNKLIEVYDKLDEPIENSEYRKRKKFLNSKYFHKDSAKRREFLWELLAAGIVSKENIIEATNLAIGMNEDKTKQYMEELKSLIAAYR